MNVSFEHVYTSIACNRTPEIVDWNSDGIMCFGANNAVALYDTNKVGGNLIKIHNHHTSKVNSVKWLKRPNGKSTEFISCSADKTAAIWTLTKGEYKVNNVLVGHKDGITSITGMYLENENLIVFTTSIDSTIKVWERNRAISNPKYPPWYTQSLIKVLKLKAKFHKKWKIYGNLSHYLSFSKLRSKFKKMEPECHREYIASLGECLLKQTINLQSGLCLTLHAHRLPLTNKPLLLCALDDHKIHIYGLASVTGESGDVEEYMKLHSLVGHEDWVRGIDVLDVDKETILLASASQDTYIRLWRIKKHKPDNEPTAGMKVEKRIFKCQGIEYCVQLDAVLAGHEGWVYGVQWAPENYNNESLSPCFRLLSSSLDKTLIVWEPEGDSDEGRWEERVRVGEVGGNGLGFYGSRFGTNSGTIMGHGYNGSFHVWRCDQSDNSWRPSVVVGGHFSSVEDVRWDEQDLFLMSVSSDQTNRVHAPWMIDESTTEWHEIARPQIHGYDLSSLSLINSNTFASSAEEKVIRVFSAPFSFLHNFENLTGVKLPTDGAFASGPEGASVPSLGLSNKAVYKSETDQPRDPDDQFVPVDMKEPPTEETLIQNTLWPESHKLYGHGYEVFSLDATPDGTLLASSCKANTAEHAAVLIWETKNWTQIQKLVSHQLTITQLAFSPDSTKLLSVSRDRRWTLYEREQDGNSFVIVACTDKSNGLHARIIWCCAWTHDSQLFATGSRDGKICLWTKKGTKSGTSLGEYGPYGQALELKGESVTALAFAPTVKKGSRFLAVGLDSGVVNIYSISEDLQWSLVLEMDKSAAHHSTVKRLTFHKKVGKDGKIMLASCGADNLVRIYRLSL